MSSRTRPLAPITPTIAQNAWEQAEMLHQDYGDRLTIQQRVLVEAARIAGPEGIGWETAGQLAVLWFGVAGVRI
jgi:hypothetical protein